MSRTPSWVEGGCWGLGDTRGGLRVLHVIEANQQSFSSETQTITNQDEQVASFFNVLAGFHVSAGTGVKL